MSTSANRTRIEAALRRQYASMEEAVAKLIGEYATTTKAASNCRVGSKQLSAYASPNDHDRFMPLDVIRDLEKSANKPIVTQWLANEHGYILIPFPDAKSKSDWDRHFHLIVKEASDVFAALAEALEDQEVSQEEANTLLAETNQALAAFAGLREILLESIQSRDSVKIEKAAS